MLKQGVILLSFDDTNIEDYTIAYQEQIDRGMQPAGTSYIITSRSAAYHLTWTQMKEMMGNGWDIQCHSHTHPSKWYDTPETMTVDEIAGEMTAVNGVFADNGLPPPRHHAHPGGKDKRYNLLIGRTISLFRLSQRTVADSYITKRVDLELLPTNSLVSMTLDEIEKIFYTCKTYGLGYGLYTHSNGLTDADALAKYRHVLDLSEDMGVRIVGINKLYEMLTR
jgi:peptidoglycan/xylan/chitin deacetylase (PgdA/CDA1 family)